MPEVMARRRSESGGGTPLSQKSLSRHKGHSHFVGRPGIYSTYYLLCVIVLTKMAEMNGNKGEEIIPQDILDTARSALHSSLCNKSNRIYHKTYEEYLSWMQKMKTNSFSEVVLVAYFKTCSDTILPSTLWARYSMLKSMIKSEKNIDISTYGNLRSFLKNMNCGFKPKKSKVFTPEEMQSYLQDAPDEQYLDVKVCLCI